jgi:hypothetical protein
VFEKAKNIEIFYNETRPALYLHFNLEGQSVKKLPLKDIIKANK